MLPIKAAVTAHSPFRGQELRFYRYSLNSGSYAASDISSAFRLINVDNVQVLLLAD